MASQEEAARECEDALAILDAAATSRFTESNTGRWQSAQRWAQQVVNGPPPPIRPTFTFSYRLDCLPLSNCPSPGIHGLDMGLAKISASQHIVLDHELLMTPMAQPAYHQSFAAVGRQLISEPTNPPADAHHHHPPPRQFPSHRKPLKEGGCKLTQARGVLGAACAQALAAAVQPGWLGQGVCRNGTAGGCCVEQPKEKRVKEGRICRGRVSEPRLRNFWLEGQLATS
ncbi:hypothetical protein DUNSADRAFT_737 [Dunaliella salina]|uniref:Encoded protein n=1 Tax=Dunaliella salina TaxID=3046 RepID=A0ABQ7GXW2_DUNSA|nr:hypothetical protein DUNSADRAFT_737 [Dunaliella salina]|eukprot:KAF5839452.1 hypothetical protein DUNSADRAFT_737 [Dunaliella salina]